MNLGSGATYRLTGIFWSPVCTWVRGSADSDNVPSDKQTVEVDRGYIERWIAKSEKRNVIRNNALSFFSRTLRKINMFWSWCYNEIGEQSESEGYLFDIIQLYS